MTLSDLWVTSLYPPPILTDFQVSVGFPLRLLDILNQLPYFSPDLCWSLGVVLIRSLLVHAYTALEQALPLTQIQADTMIFKLRLGGGIGL